MRRSDLTLFEKKYNTSSFFVDVVSSLIDRLIEFEYIPKSKANYFIEKLFQNVKDIHFGNNKQYDYKSGYYDANKKELYIKDERNIPTVYLRLLYALTTSETDYNTYRSGYGITKLSKTSYKLDHKNFGINRAIISNLVYKLCNLMPASLQLIQTEKTYTHDFLGFNIESANDMYCLEGKLLAELCFVLDIDPQILYSGLFTRNPIKVLDNVFDKKKFDKKEQFLKLFDKISRKYNTYKKLAFLSKKLNDNYIEYKKHVLENDVDRITKEQQVIEAHINDVIKATFPSDNREDDEIEFTTGLSEALEKLEAELRTNLIKFQDILADNIIKSNSHLPYAKYVNKLKCFNSMLIVPNKKITKTIQETILMKLMPENEVTGINLIQKIKYAIIESLLSDTSFTNISNTFSFYNITNFENSDTGSTLILLNSDRKFSEIVEVKGLNKSIKKSNEYELKYIPLDNLKYIMNTSYSNNFIGNVETLYTSLRNSFEHFANISLDNIFVFDYENKNYLVVYNSYGASVVSYSRSSEGYSFNLLTLSEKYRVFGKTAPQKGVLNNNLPTLYKNK